MLLSLTAGTAQAKRIDNDSRLLNRYVEARLAESASDSDTAIAIYSDALKQQPNNTQVASKAYVTAIESGNFPLALKAVQALKTGSVLDPEMPMLLFAEAFSRKDWRSANAALVELESLNNFAFVAPFLDAWISFAKGDFDSKKLRDAKSSTTAKYYYNEQLILHLVAAGQADAAAPLIGDIVNDNEARMAPVRILVAEHFVAKNETQKALSILEKKRTGPEARLYDNITAGRANGKAISAKTGLAFVFQRLSGDLSAQKADFLALVNAQLASKINSKGDFSHLISGRAYQRAKNHRYARLEFAKVSIESPYYLVALSAETSSFIQDKLFQQAGDRIDIGIKRDATSPELRILKGQLLQANDAHQQAVPLYLDAIQLAEVAQYPKPLLANYYLALGSAQEQAGIWPAGLRSLEKADALFPDSPSILNYLGYAQLERRENTDKAINTIKRAHQLRSNSPAITDSLGWAYFLNGNPDRAVDYLEQALSGQPQDPTINEHLGDAYWTVGRQYEARYAWQSAKLFADKNDAERLTSKIDLGLSPETVSP